MTVTYGELPYAEITPSLQRKSPPMKTQNDRSVSLRTRASKLFGLIGALAIASAATFAAPVPAAEAAGSKVDLRAGFFTMSFAGMEDVNRPGRPYQVAPIFFNESDTPVHAEMTVLFAEGYGKPSIVENDSGLACSTAYTDGIMPGWMITCRTTRSLGATAQVLAIRATAPSTAGQHGIIAAVWPKQGREFEADDSNNIDVLKPRFK